MIEYKLPGSRTYLERIYPNPAHLDVSTKLTTYPEVIAHFTKSSLEEDGIPIRNGTLGVTKDHGDSGYTVRFDPLPEFTAQAEQFASMHIAMLDHGHAGLALAGADVCQRTEAWNPMAGYPVNGSDGPSEWVPCLPLGMPIANHRAVTLLHYPPIIAYRNADYLRNNTLNRWKQLLACVGIDTPRRYHAILDVNPIAAPGSGESEYVNDYLPINLTSLFFDDDRNGLTYVRSMLDLMLNPPANAANPYTLPLLVCGSPVYDPQAAGWFRVRYKDQLPKNKNGTPTADVLQVGYIKVFSSSPKKTPYMIANHMIAAGVKGRCLNDPAQNIRRYEAQDLVAAMFLSLMSKQQEGTELDPAEARKMACQRWFGVSAPGDQDLPNPKNENDKLTICAMAQIDLCFNTQTRAPMYTYEQAKARCQKKGGRDYCPCFGCEPLLD
jgi:hypothetical protein